MSRVSDDARAGPVDPDLPRGGDLAEVRRAVDEVAPIPTATAIRRALREAPTLRRGLGVTVALAAFGTALNVVVPVVVQQLVDREILTSAAIDTERVLLLAGVALAAMVMAVVANRSAILRLAVAAAGGLCELRVRTFDHLMRLSMLHVQSERRGALVARVTSDIATVQDFMEWGGVQILIGSAQVTLAFIVMMIYQWQLALLVLVGGIVYAVLVRWFQKILSRAHDRVRERAAHSLAVIGEAISGLPVIRAYGAEEQTIERLDQALDEQFRAEYETGRLGAFLFSSAELFAGVLTAAVVATGLLLGAGAGISAGTLLAFLFLVNLLVDPIQGMVETLDQAQTAGAGLRRVLTLLDTPIDVADPPAGRDLPPGPLDVEFDHVTFAYPDGTVALHDVSATIPAGRRVAVVGETGSGKTTFAKLATRLIDPAEGSVRLGGIDLRSVRFASLRTRVAFVPQEGFLFDASIADNIRYGRPDASTEVIGEALEELGLETWLRELPEGLDTQVGERGSRLSSGERQLVALVRAWIGGPDLLVLDEATSAVDPALEVALRQAIERLTAGRTSITVAHRLATAEASDEVLVFDKGRLVERGSHEELLAVGGVYAGLHEDWALGTAV